MLTYDYHLLLLCYYTSSVPPSYYKYTTGVTWSAGWRVGEGERGRETRGKRRGERESVGEGEGACGWSTGLRVHLDRRLEWVRDEAREFCEETSESTERSDWPSKERPSTEP